MSNLAESSQKLINSIRLTKQGSMTAAVQSASRKSPTLQSETIKSVAVTAKQPIPKTTARRAKKASTRIQSVNNNRRKSVQAVSSLSAAPFPDGSLVWPD